MNFVFYDTETTGLHKAFDQILQFAAICTDSEFNELGRFEKRCRLLPHIVPSPGAMKATRVSVQQLTDPKTASHYSMMHEIQEKLTSWSPAVFIGYNSIDFDEPLLRQAFYQTLHLPYLTNTNGNCRVDALGVVRAAALFAPTAINFPTDGKKKILKLDQLAPANGFDHKNAHDALADVQATIHVCRLLSQKAPEIWSAALRFSQKESVLDFALGEPYFSFSDFYFGKPYSYLVTGIGVNPDDGSEIYVYDLQVDPQELSGLSDAALGARLTEKPKPIRRFRANSCPILMLEQNAPPIASALALGRPELQRRASILKADHQLCDRLIAAYISTKEKYEDSPHVEEQIYNGFYVDADQKRLAAFHDLPWEQRLDLIAQFEDERLKILGHRLLYFERPDLLDKKSQSEHAKLFAARIAENDNALPWLTLPKAIQDIDALLITMGDSSVTLLQEHRDYLVEWLGRVLPLKA